MKNQIAEEALQVPSTAGSDNVVLVASLLHLMSHYTARSEDQQPCLKLASVIERHLTALSRRPDADPVLRATCEQLSEQWAALVDERMPQPTKRPWLERILNVGWARPAEAPRAHAEA